MSKETGTKLSLLFISAATTVVFFIAAFVGGWCGLTIAIVNWLAGVLAMSGLFKNVDTKYIEEEDSGE